MTPRRRLLLVLCFALLALPALAQQVLDSATGKAAWYGTKFDGRRTASGEIFNSDYPVAAHPSWPFNTVVKVTNLANDRAVAVRIIDRGPTAAVQARGIIIDLSLGTAKVLGFVKQGLTDVRLDVLQWGPNGQPAR